MLDALNDTLELAQQLQASGSTRARASPPPFPLNYHLHPPADPQDAGCALLAVHGRYRGSPTHRRDGPAHLDQVAAVKRHLAIPVLTNGNVRSATELVEALQATGADGVMTAEAALDDPAIFSAADALVGAERARLAEAVAQGRALRAARRDGRELSEEERALVEGRKGAKARLRALPELRPPPPLSSGSPMPPPLPAGAAAAAAAPAAAAAAAPPSGMFDLAEQYIALVERHPPPGGAPALLSHTIFHLRRLCRTPLNEFNLLTELKGCADIDACAGVIRRCRAFAEGAATFTGRHRPASYWRRQEKRGKMK